MRFINFSLKVGNKVLLEKLNISFNSEMIHHILGDNGVGKSCLAKSCVGMLPYSGHIEYSEEPVLIGNYTNIPADLRLKDIFILLTRRHDQQRIQYFSELLGLKTISENILMRRLSDGQRQRIKLLWFLIGFPKTIILDEFTTALDKSSALDTYQFLNTYVKENGVTCLNITHNLSDIEYMMGRYYYFDNQTITPVATKEVLFNLYVKAGDYRGN